MILGILLTAQIIRFKKSRKNKPSNLKNQFWFFKTPLIAQKKPFKVQDYEPFLLVGNNWGYSSFENELEGQEWDDRMTCWRAVNGLGPRTVPVKSNPKGVYYRLVRWIGNQPLLNWNRFPKELI